MKTKRWNKKQLCLLLSLLLILTVTAGGTLAYIVTNTGNVTNTFTPAEVTCAVQETFENNVKNDVCIQNTGNADAYIRVAVLMTWQDESGNVAPTPVSTSDYDISYNTDSYWVESGDYWYYTKPVAPEESTDALIDSCMPKKNLDGYTLHVEIVADAVQSQPADAVKTAWGVTISEMKVDTAEGGTDQ